MTDFVTPDLLSALCHELRGPLGGLGNWAHVLGVSDLDASARSRALSGLSEDIRAMSGAVDQISSLASALSAPNAAVPLDAGPFLKGLAEEAAKASGHETPLRISEPSLRVRADPARLREMLGLFLGAASPPVEIAVTTDADVVMVTLTLLLPPPRPLSVVLARARARHQDGVLVAVVGQKQTLLHFRLPRAP